MRGSTKGVAGRMVRWPYVLAFASAALGALGVLLAPISGIVYALGLPGLLVTGVWALAHREAPARQALPLAAGIMLCGLLLGIAVVLTGDATSWSGPIVDPWHEGALLGAMLVLPLTSIVLAVVGASFGLGRGGMGRRRSHVVDLRP